MRSWASASEAQTVEIGKGLAAELEPDGVLLLFGDLGSGKSVLTRGVAEGLGYDAREIQSPTYTLMHQYRHGRIPLVHADLYRLESEQLAAVGLDEALAGAGVKVVEWADRLTSIPPDALCLRLLRGGAGRRTVEEIQPTAELVSGK